ncbi:MAG TPA: LytR family transcriptional regulator, partial [Mycobacterium sp.]|nr:LytR family transcriptional regulator [Mycobacterium sp.]
MNDNRPSAPGSDPRARREPSQVIRRDPNYRPPPSWPPNPPPRSSPQPPPRRPAPRRPAARPPYRPPPVSPHPPPPQNAKKSRRKRHWGRQVLAFLLVFVSVFVVAVVAGGLWMDSSLHRIAALADYPDRPATGKGTTWLLVGSDSRQGLTP